MPLAFQNKMSVWCGRPRSLDRKLLLTERTLSYGCCINCRSMTDCLQEVLKREIRAQSPNTINSLVWCSVCEFPSLCLGGWWPCWCMLARAGYWHCRDLAPVGSGNSVNCNEFWSEGLELCLSRRCVASCCSVAVCFFFFFVANLETNREDLRATEESECDSPPVAGGWWSRLCSVRVKVCRFHSCQAFL
jgi:hypothetical protein